MPQQQVARQRRHLVVGIAVRHEERRDTPRERELSVRPRVVGEDHDAHVRTTRRDDACAEAALGEHDDRMGAKQAHGRDARRGNRLFNGRLARLQSVNALPARHRREFGRAGDAAHRLDRAHRMQAGGRLGAEHDRIRAVENGIRHVAGLGAGGRGFWIIDSSICVAVITGRPKRLARPMMRFCCSGTCSKGSSTPRSPRATITASETLRMPSMRSSAESFSILATTSMPDGSMALSSTMSSGRRTKLSAR